MKKFKIGDKVKHIGHEKSPVITIVGVYPDTYISGSYVINGIEDEQVFKISDLSLYKSLECSEVLQLMDSSEYANYCQSLETILTKYPNVNRAELEKELNVFI